jgi:SAM-dependent methyltransferase
MDRATQRALATHNREFYQAHAAHFSATREHPWPGWQRIADGLSHPGSLDVLDVGCGNGRLGAYLQSARTPAPLRYTGVDGCAPLLADARKRLPDAVLREADLVQDPLDQALPRGPFDLVCAFGVLHHVPGFNRRRALVEALAERVEPNGWLALAFWRFAERPRFTHRTRDWSLLPAIDPGALEPGDHLLGWGQAGAVRYCHASDDREIDALVERLGLPLRDDFEADGREGDLNRYLVFGRSHD